MNKLSLTNLNVEPKDVLQKKALKTVLGGSGCTVTCENEFVSGSVSCEGAYWVCFHSGGPTNGVVSCIC